jgi:WbqC-like protein family
MTSVAIMQPVYLPWMGYFEQMALCDHFIFLDDVQYTKQDWRNRNKIRTKENWCWLTIPVRKAGLHQPLCAVQISDHKDWKRAHLLSVRQNYGRTPFFDDIYPVYENALQEPHIYLADLTIRLITDFAALLRINTPVQRASTLPGDTDDPVLRIVQLCRRVNADVFYTGPAAKAYLSPKQLEPHGVKLVFQDYQHPRYTQAYPGFESHMAILDVLMNHGDTAKAIVRSSPAPAALQP